MSSISSLRSASSSCLSFPPHYLPSRWALLPCDEPRASSPSPSSNTNGTKKQDIDTGKDEEESPPTAREREFRRLHIQRALLSWYAGHARVLPWRRPPRRITSSNESNFDSETATTMTTMLTMKTEGEEVEEREEVGEEEEDHLESKQQQRAYGVLVSEIMLQQTRVATVIDYWKRWMQRWPDITNLARATEDEVRAQWAGLGYYRRAINLYRAAQVIVERYHGIIPSTRDELLELPGIGRYTASAIASIAFGECVGVLDGNVSRVFSRLVAESDPVDSRIVEQRFWALTNDLARDCVVPGDLNQALMELGATVCLPKSADCQVCPLSLWCDAYLASRGDSSLVTQYPYKKPKAEVPQEHWMTLCMKRLGKDPLDHQLLFIKRPENCLLGGFWELASVPISVEEFSEEDIGTRVRVCFEALFQAIGLMPRLARDWAMQCSRIGSTRHLYSHLDQHISVFSFTFPEESTSSLQSIDTETEFLWSTEEIPWMDGWKYDGGNGQRSAKWVSVQELESIAISTGMKKVMQLVESSKKDGKRQAKLDTFFVPKRKTKSE